MEEYDKAQSESCQLEISRVGKANSLNLKGRLPKL